MRARMIICELYRRSLPAVKSDPVATALCAVSYRDETEMGKPPTRRWLQFGVFGFNDFAALGHKKIASFLAKQRHCSRGR